MLHPYSSAEFKTADVTASKARLDVITAALGAAAEHRAEWAVGALRRRRAAALTEKAARGWAGMAAAGARAAKTGARMWRRRMQSLARQVLYSWAQDTVRILSARSGWGERIIARSSWLQALF